MQAALDRTFSQPVRGEILENSPNMFMRRVTVITLVCSVLGAAVILSSNGSLSAAAGFLALLVLCGITLIRLEWGFLAYLGIVLSLEQFEIPGFPFPTSDVRYFNNMNTIPYLSFLPGGVVSPMDLHLVFLLMVWVAISLLNGTFRTRHVPVWPLLVLFLCWLAILLVRGMSVGGDFVAALWELRGFFYFGIMIAFVPQIVWTKEQLHVLLWVCIGAMGFRACLGASRFILSGFSMAGYDTFLSHEDPLFIVTLLVFLGALVLFEVRTRQKVVLALLLPPLLLGFYSGNRRAAYASLAVSVVAFMSLLPRKESIRFWKALAPVLVVAVMYAVVFWTSDSKLATPLKQLKSGFEDDSELTERNYWSNLYRKIEDYNLAATIQRSPIVGIGFGTKYDQPLVLVEIAFSLRDYMAHNNVLWLFAKTGVVGFFLFWFLMNGYAVKAAGLVARLQDPYAKAVVVLILVAIINQMSAAYFDLHLVRYRTMIYLGVLMGLLPVLVTEVDGKLHKGVLHAA